MATDKPFLSFVIDEELLQRIDDYRFARRFPSRAEAIKFLLLWSLPKNPDPEREKVAAGRAKATSRRGRAARKAATNGG